jgi:hypothetical protein
MLQPDAAALQRLHYEHEHPCCWLLDVDTQCGLWCGHDGDHVPYTPGDYLPPPIIGLLDLLRLQQRPWPHWVCPLCGAHADHISCDAPFSVQRDGDGNASWYAPGAIRVDIECAWRFEPCGCEGREILSD